MAKYTIELRHIDNTFKVFNFDYNFYTEDPEIKKNFERKFIDEYYFNEIGFETVARFQHRLKTRLNKISNYYSQLYKTQLEAENINFLLNKDLKETFEREITGENKTLSEVLATGSSVNNFKESSIEDGNASLFLNDNGLTTVNKNDNTSNSNSSNKGNTSNNQKETTSLVSQGNIGITSSAELLEKWRKVLINLDELIINDCADLFMQIF